MASVRSFLCAMFIALPCAIASAQIAGENAIDVASFSGSPLLLEITVPARPDTTVRAGLTTDTSTIGFTFVPDEDETSVRVVATPFLKPGTGRLSISARYDPPELVADGPRFDAGTPSPVLREELRVGFVDFVFGRDNLRFGNTDTFRSVVGSFGQVLEMWLDDRFGGTSEADLVLLVDFMYGLFGANTGRCYAFSGSEVRYWIWPDLLPAYYKGAYSIGPDVYRWQREMGFLQLDMAYNEFVTHGGHALVGAMDRDSVLSEVEAIIHRIDAGLPVAVGFAGPDFHHSMAVFGYIENRARHRVDLLVANNWKSDEALNLHSRDAEMVRIELDPSLDAPEFEWRYDEGVRSSVIDRLFIVEVARDEYERDPADLSALTGALESGLRAGGRAIVVVEDAAEAWLSDGERFSGRMHGRDRDEIEGVFFDRASRSYRFAYPVDLPLTLYLADDRGTRVLAVSPGPGGGVPLSWIRTTDTPPAGETITREIALHND